MNLSCHASFLPISVCIGVGAHLNRLCRAQCVTRWGTPCEIQPNQTPPYPHHPGFRSDSDIPLTYYSTLLIIKIFTERGGCNFPTNFFITVIYEHPLCLFKTKRVGVYIKWKTILIIRDLVASRKKITKQ